MSEANQALWDSGRMTARAKRVLTTQLVAEAWATMLASPGSGTSSSSLGNASSVRHTVLYCKDRELEYLDKRRAELGFTRGRQDITAQEGCEACASTLALR